jgi:hypothetical protein
MKFKWSDLKHLDKKKKKTFWILFGFYMYCLSSIVILVFFWSIFAMLFAAVAGSYADDVVIYFWLSPVIHVLLFFLVLGLIGFGIPLSAIRKQASGLAFACASNESNRYYDPSYSPYETNELQKLEQENQELKNILRKKKFDSENDDYII